MSVSVMEQIVFGLLKLAEWLPFKEIAAPLIYHFIFIFIWLAEKYPLSVSRMCYVPNIRLE